jgi:hypothetical protein
LPAHHADRTCTGRYLAQGTQQDFSFRLPLRYMPMKKVAISS